MTKQAELTTSANCLTYWNGELVLACTHDEVWVHSELKGIGYCVQCGKTIKLIGG